MTSLDLPDRVERIRGLLREAPEGMTSRQLVAALGCTVDQVRRALECLRRQGQARVAANTARHSRWVLDDPSAVRAESPPEEHDDTPYTLSPSGRPLTPKDEDE